jgi:ATP phosphoribosyltransferase regulatory subunit
MSFSKNVLRSDELAIYNLRELYRKFGYSQYKVSRFEEYDLYAHNKSFLVSENVLTFTDTNGKLMALKPDVTLSIIKNISAQEKMTHKLYYNENVYRTLAESHGFKEIMQTGLECIGSIDTFAESEVIMLAAKSLESISEEYILDISHMGLIEGFLDFVGIQTADRAEFLKFVQETTIATAGASKGNNAPTKLPDFEKLWQMLYKAE